MTDRNLPAYSPEFYAEIEKEISEIKNKPSKTPIPDIELIRIHLGMIEVALKRLEAEIYLKEGKEGV